MRLHIYTLAYVKSCVEGCGCDAESPCLEKQLRSVHVELADSQHSASLQQGGPSTEWQKPAGPVQYLHVVDPRLESRPQRPPPPAAKL